MVFQVLSSAGVVVATATTGAQTMAAGTNATFSAALSVSAAQLWSLEHPTLYTLHATVLAPNAVDVYNATFGFRQFDFDPDTGLHLNGQSVKVQGMANHQGRTNKKEGKEKKREKKRKKKKEKGKC